MARRGEANFVAVRVGFWTDPHIMVMADELKVSVGEAGSYVIRWEELVLAAGDARSGRVKGYSAKYIALALGWRGNPARLISALKTIGVLSSQRGTFVHPFWRETRTGDYALRRAEEAERSAKRRREEETNAASDHGRAPVEPRSDHPPTTDEIRSSGDQGRKDDRGPAPQPPPHGGGGVGQTRWQWLLEHHDRPRNPAACVKYLEALNDQEWQLVQFAVTLRQKAGGVYIGRRKRVWQLAADDFLRKGAYLEFHREWQEKQRGPKGGKPQPKQPDVVDLISSSDKFVLAQLADPELSDAEKERIRSGWRARHPNETPPWEVA